MILSRLINPFDLNPSKLPCLKKSTIYFYDTVSQGFGQERDSVYGGYTPKFTFSQKYE